MAAIADPIERMNLDAQAAIDALSQPDVASVRTSADDFFRRLLILSIGSYCEKRVVLMLERFCDKASASSVELCTFVKTKALTRQYHTWFQWDASNANSFSKLFGPRFHKSLAAAMEADRDIENGARCFLQLGAIRNKIAHEGLEYEFSLSREDVMRDYRAAIRFIAAVEELLGV